MECLRNRARLLGLSRAMSISGNDDLLSPGTKENMSDVVPKPVDKKVSFMNSALFYDGLSNEGDAALRNTVEEFPLL